MIWQVEAIPVRPEVSKDNPTESRLAALFRLAECDAALKAGVVHSSVQSDGLEESKLP
jgi:hypothetical protein